MYLVLSETIFAAFFYLQEQGKKRFQKREPRPLSMNHSFHGSLISFREIVRCETGSKGGDAVGGFPEAETDDGFGNG